MLQELSAKDLENASWQVSMQNRLCRFTCGKAPMRGLAGC